MEVEVNNTSVKKGYEFLRELCSFNADFTAFSAGRENPITNRVQYIMHQLENNGIAYTVDKFQVARGVPDATDESKRHFVNIVVEIKGTDETKTTVFLAHHDVNNPASENCQDNTASLANLLDLSIKLTNEKPTNNVVIAFVDAEEIVAPAICGSQRLAQNIKKGKYGQVKYAVNLELTANGRNYWMSYRRTPNILAEHIKTVQPETMRVNTPYNDAFILEGEGVASVCVGSLDNENVAQIKQSGFGCKTWSMCHRMEDTFESQAVEADMDLFVDYLKTLI